MKSKIRKVLRILTPIIVGGLLGVAMGISFAEVQVQSADPPLAMTQTPQGESLKEIVGKISSVNPRDRMVALKTGLFGSSSFQVDWGTIITEGNDRLRLSDLRVGDQVQIKYASQDGGKLAREINIRQKHA